MLFEEGAEVLHMTFNAVGKTNLNWFSKKSLLLSPWDDLKTTVELQYFAIRGSTNAKRSFEVTKRYGGCKKDAGWLIIRWNSLRGTGKDLSSAKYSIQQPE